MLKRKTFLYLCMIIGLLYTNFTTTNAQTTCSTATPAVVGVNSAPAQSEIWYQFSVSGKPLASYSVNYDSKSLNVDVTVFSGSCDNLLTEGRYIPAVANDARTYYIRFQWRNGSSPQVFSWELYQSLVVPMTGIDVTPKTYSPSFGGSFTINNVFTVNKMPSNATTSYLTEYVILDYEDGILQADNSGAVINGKCVISGSTQVSAVGTGSAKIAFVAMDWNNYSGVGQDTVTINLAAPALCSLATTISAGANNAAAVQEQWFHFTPTKSGIYTVSFEDVDIDGDGKVDLVTNWAVYKGDCDGLRKVETTYSGNAVLGFQAEAGQLYSIKLYQYDYYGLVAFNWTLAEPKTVTGFSLTTKTLELALPQEGSTSVYELSNLGLNFTPADATDKGVSVTVRDESLLSLAEDGRPDIYKDAIATKGKAGSTYIVFTTRDGGFKDSCLVTVHYVHLTSFALTQHEKTLWLPYSTAGKYVHVNDTSALRVVCAPENATEKRYTVSVRKKGIVSYDGGGLQAMREGSTWVVFTAKDGGLRDSVLIHVTRTVSGGSPCTGATIALLGGNNDMPAVEYHTEWFKFTPSESANYGMTALVEKYPFVTVEVYEGACSELYLIADGSMFGVHSDENCEVGFYGEAGKTYYLKLTTQDYNTMGGGVIIPYKWLIKKVSASISGTVTFSNASPAQGKVELYSVKTGKTALVETTDIQTGGAYSFADLTVGNYAVRAVTTGGDIAWYGINAPYFTDNWTETFIANTATGIDITVTPKTSLNEGTSTISGYIVKSEDLTPESAPSVQRVKFADGAPVAGITVFLQRNDNQRNDNVIAYTLTNAAGYFEFSGVGAGDYQVVVQIVGIESEVADVTISEDGETVELAYEVSETAVENTTPAGIGETEIMDDELRIYPNPARDELFIQSAQPIENVTIYNLSGTQMVNCQWANRKYIDVSHLPAGIYLVKIGAKTIRLVKE